jgi:hypothetical protein
MSKLFGRNIETKGRVFRGIVAVILLLGGLYALTQTLWLGLMLLAVSGFVLFEALRGWCVMRACGIKTRL